MLFYNFFWLFKKRNQRLRTRFTSPARIVDPNNSRPDFDLLLSIHPSLSKGIRGKEPQWKPARVLEPLSNFDRSESEALNFPNHLTETESTYDEHISETAESKDGNECSSSGFEESIDDNLLRRRRE